MSTEHTVERHFTAELTSINDERLTDPDDWTGGTTSWDTVTITEWPSGQEVATIEVESSEDQEPYERAVWDAGYHEAKWL